MTAASTSTAATEPLLEFEAETATPGGRRRPVLVGLALVWLGLVVGCAVGADLLPLPDPAAGVAAPRIEPFTTWSHPLGTDALGRSELSRLIFGARVSLMVGIVAALSAATIGGLIGVFAGYSRKRVDPVVSLVSDGFLAFPPLIILLAIAAALEPSVSTVIVGLVLVTLPTFVRLARANTLRFVDQEFVLAARVMGARPRRLIFREIVPNVIPPVAALGMVIMATLMVAEASLSYLGMGIRPPTPSWGGMIAAGQPELTTHAFLVFVPAGVLVLTIYSLHIAAEWVRAHQAS